MTRKGIFLFFGSVLSVALLFASVWAVAADTTGDDETDWQLETIDEARYFWTWNPCNAVFRDGGSLHVAYAGDKVFLARTGLDGANIYVLDDEAGATGAVSLARGDTGDDLAAYVLSGSARVAAFDGADVTKSVVDEGPGVSGDISLLVDATGTHLVYFNSLDEQVLYRFADPGGDFGASETAASTANGRHRAFLDSDGTVAVVYADETGLHVVRKTGGGFSTPEMIDSSALVVEALAVVEVLRVRGDGAPALVAPAA